MTAAAYRYGLLAVLGGAIAFFGLAQPAFLTWSNASVIGQSVVVVAITGIGVTASMTVGGFDLSVGSAIDFVVMVTALTMVQFDLTGATAVAFGLLAGLMVALVNVLLIVVARIPDLVASLGTMFAFQGLALIITAGQPVSSGMIVGARLAPGKYTAGFLWLGQGSVGPVPTSVIIAAVLAGAFWVFFERTRWGRSLYAIGAILLSSRLGRGDVSVGDPYLLEAVAATLTGFAVFGANGPNVLGTVIGSVFIGVVLDGLTMMNAPYYIQDFVEGALLIAALLMSFTLRRR